LRVDDEGSLLVDVSELALDGDQRAPVGERIGDIELGADLQLAISIDIAPGIAGKDRCETVFEAAGVKKLRLNDDFAGRIDISDFAIDGDGKDRRTP
jgi:hypothetical protein